MRRLYGWLSGFSFGQRLIFASGGVEESDGLLGRSKSLIVADQAGACRILLISPPLNFVISGMLIYPFIFSGTILPEIKNESNALQK